MADQLVKLVVFLVCTCDTGSPKGFRLIDALIVHEDGKRCEIRIPFVIRLASAASATWFLQRRH